MLRNVAKIQAGKFIWRICDAHAYHDMVGHLEQKKGLSCWDRDALCSYNKIIPQLMVIVTKMIRIFLPMKSASLAYVFMSLKLRVAFSETVLAMGSSNINLFHKNDKPMYD